jgi:hypothetical protein
MAALPAGTADALPPPAEEIMPSPFRSPFHPMARLVLLAAVALLPACGRTGLRLPDLRPFRAPLCTSDTTTVRVSTSPDPLVPTGLTISRVEYHVSRLCSNPSQDDPQQPSTGWRSLNCIVTVYTHGNVEQSGDCIGPPGGAPSPSWRVGSSTGRTPNDVFFEMQGATQGNFCVQGTVTFTNGTTAELPRRMWRVQLRPGRFVPPVGYWITRNNDTGADPIVNPASASAPGCTPGA